MKRKLMLLNAALAALLVLGAFELNRRGEEAQARFSILEDAAGEKQPGEYAPPAPPPRVRQADYLPIVHRDLFSKDRNATVEVIEAEAEVVERPPLPVIGGLVDFGDGPVALLAPDAETPASWLAVGEKVGEFVFQGVEGEKIKLAWKEEEFEVNPSQLIAAEPVKAAPRRPARAAASRPAAPAAAGGAALGGGNLTQSSAVGGEHNIGRELRPGVFSADPKDKAPDGTVYKGYVKTVRPTPFGAQQWWVKKAGEDSGKGK